MPRVTRSLRQLVTCLGRIDGCPFKVYALLLRYEGTDWRRAARQARLHAKRSADDRDQRSAGGATTTTDVVAGVAPGPVHGPWIDDDWVVSPLRTRRRGARARLMYWPPGSFLDYHHHGPDRIAGLRVLSGGTLSEIAIPHVTEGGGGRATRRGGAEVAMLGTGDVSVITPDHCHSVANVSASPPSPSSSSSWYSRGRSGDPDGRHTTLAGTSGQGTVALGVDVPFY
jgi:hypothetical protein